MIFSKNKNPLVDVAIAVFALPVVFVHSASGWALDRLLGPEEYVG